MAESGSPQLNAACTFLTFRLVQLSVDRGKVNEFSISSTNTDVGQSPPEIGLRDAEEIGIPTHIFQKCAAGTGWENFMGSGHGPGCHDTGSAVAGVPCQGKNFGYISSGTWSLAGLKSKPPS